MAAAVICPKGYSYKTTKWGTIDTEAFMEVLELKVGARICLIFNVNTVDGLVNGSLGTVINFEWNKNEGNLFPCQRPDKLRSGHFHN